MKNILLLMSLALIALSSTSCRRDDGCNKTCELGYQLVEINGRCSCQPMYSGGGGGNYPPTNPNPTVPPVNPNPNTNTNTWIYPDLFSETVLRTTGVSYGCGEMYSQCQVGWGATQLFFENLLTWRDYEMIAGQQTSWVLTFNGGQSAYLQRGRAYVLASVSNTLINRNCNGYIAAAAGEAISTRPVFIDHWSGQIIDLGVVGKNGTPVPLDNPTIESIIKNAIGEAPAPSDTFTINKVIIQKDGQELPIETTLRMDKTNPETFQNLEKEIAKFK